MESELRHCRMCKIDKPLSEWRWHPSQNRWSRICNVCMRADTRASYARNKPHRLIAQREYKKSEAGKKTAAKFNATSIKRYPEKWKAGQKLRYAVSSGKIQKQPCQECGEVKVEAHHYLGYSPEHWYDVKWLCHPHHRDIHKFSLRSRGLEND